MIEEISVTLRKQTASDGCWLWKEQGEDIPRYFTKFVYLSPTDTEWPECTDAEKVEYEEEWQRTHPQPQPEPQPEPQEPQEV